MPANIANINGVDAMFAVGARQDVWHQLGQRVVNAATAAEALKLASLDWEVCKRQNFALNPFSNKLEKMDSYSIIRASDGVQLGTVGADYTVKQNAEMFDFVDTLLECNGGSHYDTAGALGKGERVWMAVRLPKADFSVMGQDAHETYLVFISSHDGSMAHTVLLTSVRVVCQNTVNLALSSASQMVKVKHTKNGDSRLARVKELISGVQQTAQTLKAKFDTLAQRKMTHETTQQILERLFGKPELKADGKLTAAGTRKDNILQQVLANYESNDQNAFPDFRGSAFNLLNAITEYADHQRDVRMTAGREGMTEATARAENAAAGSADDLKTEALKVIVEMTAGAPINRIVSRPINGGSGPVAGVSLLDQIINN